jgi:hypothetical protein
MFGHTVHSHESENKKRLFPKQLHRFVFLMVTPCVFCEVGTEFVKYYLSKLHGSDD